MLRACALQKLQEESFNAEVAATLATLAPAGQRARVVEAIVALQVMYDYLDGLTETSSEETPNAAGDLFAAFTDALAACGDAVDKCDPSNPLGHDGRYLQALATAVRLALAQLPAIGAMREVLRISAARTADAQVHIHMASHSDSARLQAGAMRDMHAWPLAWRELLAGSASSVLAVHALIAAAADPRSTYEQAVEIDRTYLSISVLPTVLDSLVDYEHDIGLGRPGYVQYYSDHASLNSSLVGVIRDALTHARKAPHSAHHVMTLVGVVAYYASNPTGRSEMARPVMAQLERELRPVIIPTLTVMRAWRVAKRVHRLWHRQQRIGAAA